MSTQREQRKAANNRYRLSHKSECAARSRAWREAHREAYLVQRHLYYQLNKGKILVDNRIHKQQIKQEIFAYYGNKCACCGETHIEFLCIDHINGGGMEHRRQIKVNGGTEFYAWLKRHNFPMGFRVLCHNCNAAISAFGYCPHTKVV